MAETLTIANTILYCAFKNKTDITPMKLQKLMYFVYKKYLQDTDMPLFSERFEPWQYGPVLTSVYEIFKDYGANYINELYYDKNNKAMVIDIDIAENFKKSFDYVWDNYYCYTGSQLSAMTHRDDTAWDIAYKNNYRFLKDEDIMKEKWYFINE